MDYLALTVTAVVSLISGGASVARLGRARIIEDTPTSKIRSAHQGYVELIGVADDDNDLIAPLTQRPCLWYHYRIEEYRRSGKNSHWNTVQQGSSDAPFALKDASGHCFVFPAGAAVNTHRRKVWQGSKRFPAGSTSTGFAANLGLSLLGGRYRYTEELLCQHDPIYVLGSFSSHHPPSPQQLAEEAQARILAQWKQDYSKLLARFDRDNNGQIDMQEWQLARAEALRKAEREVEQRLPQAVVHSVTATEDRRRPYLIATSEPTALSRRFRWQAAGLFALCVASAAALVWQVLPLLS